MPNRLTLTALLGLLFASGCSGPDEMWLRSRHDAVAPGDRVRFEAICWTEDEGERRCEDELVWSSSDPEVATVAADGEVTAVSRGTTHIEGRLGDLLDRLPLYVVPGLETLATTRVHPDELHLYDGRLYWLEAGFDEEAGTSFGQLLRMKPGSPPERLLSRSDSVGMLWVDDTGLLWTEQEVEGTRILAASHDGTGERLVAVVPGRVDSVVAAADRIFLARYDDSTLQGEIAVVTRSSGSSETWQQGDFPFQLHRSGRWLYWVDGERTLYRRSLDGGAARSIARLPDIPQTFVFGREGILFVGRNDQRIYRLPPAGGKAAVLIDSGTWPRALALSDGTLYWATGDDRILAHPLEADEAPPQEVAFGQESASHLLVAGRWLYWLSTSPDTERGTVRRIPR